MNSKLEGFEKVTLPDGYKKVEKFIIPVGSSAMYVTEEDFNRSTYLRLFVEYPGKVGWGTPVRSGQRTKDSGWEELDYDCFPLSPKDRADMLREYLNDGYRVSIKTANGYGHARFWVKK